jgi:Tfp pilus assembly protein PilF
MLPVGVLSILTWIVYAQTLGHEFLTNWDDQLYVINNPAIRGMTLANLKAAFSRFYAGNYAPVQIISYMIDYTFWGMNATGYFLSNILLHLCNGVLLYAVLIRASWKRLPAVLATAIFLLHPVQVETVAWISQRKNLLAMFFFLLAFHFYLSYREDRRNLWYYGASLGAFVFALFAKSVAVILPPALLLTDLAFGSERRNRLQLVDKIPYVVAAALAAIITLKSQGEMFTGGMKHSYYGGSPLATFFTMVPVFLRYIRMILWPAHLSAFYEPPIKTFPDTEVVVAGLFLALVLAGTAWLCRHNRQLCLWAGVFVLGLIPVSQVVPLITLMNDRYLYFPLLGAAPGFVFAAGIAIQGLPAGLRTLCATVAILTLTMLPLLSWQRAAVWRNSLTLWSDAARKVPGSELVSFTLGATYHSLGQLDDALSCYKHALSLGPPSRDVLHNISMLYMSRWDFAHAREYVNLLVEKYPDYPGGYNLLGEYRYKTGNLAGAAEAYGTALHLNPGDGDAHRSLGAIRLMMNDPGAAREQYLQALAAGADNADMRYDLATIELQAGRPAEALLQLEAALKLGYNNRHELATGTKLAPLRTMPEFRQLLERYPGP